LCGCGARGSSVQESDCSGQVMSHSRAFESVSFQDDIVQMRFTMVIPIACFEMDISDFVHSSRVEHFEQIRPRLRRKQ
jgi:hypothetical protein